ncbi:MAG: membrane-bound PQQ-dependent dehydrogenase, glucose/quinate/shikimate family [Burkholderiales bacterium]|nr:MAG: membrane-bound PQQ-dependent dehydrogenase, glucose/quinate/shikimate family [Burkholderiales bacterium]
MTSTTISRGWAVLATRALAGVIVLVGAVLAIGGAWLIVLDGSAYYFVAGAALVASGYYLFRLKLLGVWIYFATFGVTFLWALAEAGLDGWAHVPRLVGPLILLVLVIFTIPVMRDGSGLVRLRNIELVVTAAATLVFGLVLYAASRAPSPLPLPAASGASADVAGPDWLAYGGTYGAKRYSTLSQINADNANTLTRAWVAHTRDLPAQMKGNSYGAETTPLKIGDALYLCSAKNILIALNPVTGQEKWRYDPGVPDESIPYTAACRGVTYYVVPGATADAPCATRIIEGTLDARLISVDARTGAPCSGFGTNGAVSITRGMGETLPGYVSITSPPVIVRGLIVTGHQVLDGQDRLAPSGVIQAFDVLTGELRWAWDMTRPDLTGLPAEGDMWTRGTPNMWTTATADEALGLVYLPMGVSAVDYWSGSRTPAEDEYATSLVALDVTTGKPAWHFQTVHIDVWDYDLGSQGTLVDFPTPGGATPALILPSKQGDIYVLDRRTGKPLTEVRHIPVPAGGVEPERRSNTQPTSLYHTLRKPQLKESDMWGMSLIDQMICRIQFQQAKYDGFYTPPTSDRHWIEYPGYNGGSDWGGIAVDPVRGVIVANYNDMPNLNRLLPRAEADRKGWKPRGQERGGDLGGGGAEGAGDPQANSPYAIDVNAGWRMPFTNLLCKEPPYGGMRAIELRTGKTLWDRPFGTAHKNGPFGIPSMLPMTIGTPNNGGAVVTAGGVVFVAATTDDRFRAIDLATGKVLFEDALPGGGQATPMTYEANGRQYVAIMAGGHHFMETPISDALVAYALP